MSAAAIEGVLVPELDSGEMPAVTWDPDEVLLAELSGPPSLEQARTSLEFWTQRRSALPVYRRGARREAEEMIQRSRQRVAAAERRRFGTGPMAFVRRMLAGDGLSWSAARASLVTLVWALVPRRLVYVATAFMLVWLLVGVLALVTIAQLLA